LIKSPKIYFVDTGIACSLLNIRSAEDLLTHYLRGGLIESLIISYFLKQQHNFDRQPNLYFWRDRTGNEIDCIVDDSQQPIPIEIKAGKTIASDFFDVFSYWERTTGFSKGSRYLIYGGIKDQAWPQANVLGWKSAGNIMKKILEE